MDTEDGLEDRQGSTDSRPQARSRSHVGNGGRQQDKVLRSRVDVDRGWGKFGVACVRSVVLPYSVNPVIPQSIRRRSKVGVPGWCVVPVGGVQRYCRVTPPVL